jgi:hypothetical protein
VAQQGGEAAGWYVVGRGFGVGALGAGLPFCTLAFCTLADVQGPRYAYRTSPAPGALCLCCLPSHRLRGDTGFIGGAHRPRHHPELVGARPLPGDARLGSGIPGPLHQICRLVASSDAGRASNSPQMDDGRDRALPGRGLAVAARPGVPTLGALQTFWLGFYSVLFGFSFVILYQGLLLVAFRASMPEVGVWFLTSLMFAFLGMIFAFILGGQTFLGYAETIGVWFLLGTSLYVVRMAQGSLVPAMLVCVLWDFALRTGSVVATDRVIRRPDWSVDGLSPVEGLTFWLMLIVTVVAAWRIILAKNAATAAKPLPLRRTSEK